MCINKCYYLKTCNHTHIKLLCHEDLLVHHECEFSQHSTDDSLVDFNNVMDPVISKRLNHQKLEVIINIKILNPDMHFIKTKKY